MFDVTDFLVSLHVRCWAKVRASTKQGIMAKLPTTVFSLNCRGLNAKIKA